MGEPEIERNAGTVCATEVTLPPPVPVPELAQVTVPSALIVCMSAPGQVAPAYAPARPEELVRTNAEGTLEMMRLVVEAVAKYPWPDTVRAVVEAKLVMSLVPSKVRLED